MTVLEADGLGRRFGRRVALDGCSFTLPAGRFAALVGPNGAGKTTLLKIATGLLAPTSGRITVLGRAPDAHGTPDGLSFLAQERPLYRTFRVAEMVRAGAALNAGGRWDGAYVDGLVADAGLDPAARVSALSEGQRSRLALALALGRRPDLLLLDEPLAALDPLARRTVLGALLAEVAEHGTTVLMSTHVLADLDGVADHLVLLRGGGVALRGDVDDLLTGHRTVTGLADAALPGEVVHARRTGRQVTALVRGPADPTPGLEIATPTLEELVLAHLDPTPDRPRADRGGVVIWLVWRRLRIPLLVSLGLVAVVVGTAVVGRVAWLATVRDLGIEGCMPRPSVCTSQAWADFRNGYDSFRYLLTIASVLLPGLAGAIAGGALFGSETARGTHVFALSQALPRARWWATGLLVAGAPVAVAVALVPPVLVWAAAPFDQHYVTTPLSPSTFLTSGVVPAAYAVLAFCVAATAGLLLRSTVGALGLAVGVHVAAVLITTLLARPVYLPPETDRAALPPGSDQVPVLVRDDGGLSVGYGYVDAAGTRVPRFEVSIPCEAPARWTDCLRAAGFTDVYSTYHPPSRYWPFQAIESGLLLALATAALGAGLWGLRRRVH